MAERSKNLTLQDTVANQTKKKKLRESESKLIAGFSWTARICVLLAILTAPWMVASVTSGAQLFISVLLMIGIGCWWIETALRFKDRQLVPYIALFILLGMGLGFMQTMPLSEGFTNLMAGRQIEFHETFFQGESDSAVPIRLSLDTEGTWHQLRMLVIALVSLLLVCRYFRNAKHLKVFYSSVLINGVLLTAFGLLQKLPRFEDKFFGFYEVQEKAAPFASFVCRNNAAGYLVMCLAAGVGLFMLLITGQQGGKPQLIVSKEIPFWRQISTYLSMFAEKLDATKIAIMIACVFISVGVFASFSRGGVLTLLGGCIAAALIYNVTRQPKFAGLLLLPIAAVTIATVFLAGYGDNIIAKFEKIDSLNVSQSDARVKTWQDTLPAGFENGWFGTGLGSYRSVHRIYRSNPESTIFEYAENQYVQTIVEAGIPGLILLSLAILVGFWYMLLLLIRGGSGTTVGTGVFAALLLSSQLIAAIFDFGWYIPANMILFAAGMGVVSQQAHGLAGRLKKPSLLRFQCPNWLCQVLILGSFLFTMFVVYSLFQTTMITREFSQDYRHDTLKAFEASNFDDVNDKITSLTPKVLASPSSNGLNYLGDLHIMRARMQYLELLKEGDAYRNLTGEVRDQMEVSLWNLTGLIRLHQKIEFLKRERETRLVNDLKSQHFYQVDLQQALLYYQASRRLSPLQPETQMLIGQLTTLLRDRESAKLETAKTLMLSPQNPGYRLKCAISQLQSGDAESGIKNLRHFLSLNPKQYFGRTMNLAAGLSDRQIPAIDDERIVEEIIGDDPVSLYRFAKELLGPEDPYRQQVLEKANGMLLNISMSDSEKLQLKADINFEKGDWKTGIEFLQMLVRSDPSNQNIRFRLANTLYEYGLYEESQKEIQHLYKINEKSKKYKQLFDKVIRKLKETKEAEAKARLGIGSTLNLTLQRGTDS